MALAAQPGSGLASQTAPGLGEGESYRGFGGLGTPQAGAGITGPCGGVASSSM